LAMPARPPSSTSEPRTQADTGRLYGLDRLASTIAAASLDE
jgi:hypothetical protein